MREIKLLLNQEKEKAEKLEKEKQELAIEKRDNMERIERLKLQLQSSSNGNTGPSKGVSAAVKQDKKIVEALATRTQALEVICFS